MDHAAARGLLIVAAAILIAACGGDSDPTTNASNPTKPDTTTQPTQAAKGVCKDYGGVSPNQRRIAPILADGTRCKDGIITNGVITISRPEGGWKSLLNP